MEIPVPGRRQARTSDRFHAGRPPEHQGGPPLSGQGAEDNAQLARKAALDAEVERIKQACDEHNRKAGIALLDSLGVEERGKLDSEFLARYGDVPLLGKRFRQEGRKSPLVLALYLIFLREKRPEASISYLQYAKAHKVNKKVVKALGDK